MGSFLSTGVAGWRGGACGVALSVRGGRLGPTLIFRRFTGVGRVPHPSGRRRGVVRFLGRFNGDRGLRAMISRANGILVHGTTAPKCRGTSAVVLRDRVSVMYSGLISMRFSFRGSTVRACMSNR